MTWAVMRVVVRWVRDRRRQYLATRHPVYGALAQEVQALAKAMLKAAKG